MMMSLSIHLCAGLGAFCIDILIIVSQAVMNVAACLGAVTGPLVIGAFTKADVVNGWKKFYVSRPPPYLGSLSMSSELTVNSGCKWPSGV